MRFEKWQALGNDYLIVERDRLPQPLTPAGVRLLCDPHRGPGGDGVLQLEPPDADGHVARLRIFNPDGSEAELSGNGARQALLYLHRHGWARARTFSIQTVAGEIRTTLTGERTARVAMGRARRTSDAYADDGPDGTGTVVVDGRTRSFQHVQIGNPQCAIRIPDRDELEALDLPAVGPAIEHDPRFPRRTNVSFWCEAGPSAIRARIFERGVGETRSSGTGACGAAVAHVLRGGDSLVTVQLDGGELVADVDEALGVALEGWAVPVYAGELSAELLADLAAAG